MKDDTIIKQYLPGDEQPLLNGSRPSPHDEEAIIFQIEIFENMIQNCAVAIFAINKDHHIVHWNRACEELTGIRELDIIGTRNHWKAFYSSERPCLSDLIVDREVERLSEFYDIHSPSLLISNGFHAEGWYTNIGGKKRYIIFDAAPIYYQNNRLLGAVETIQDITLLKQMEEEKERLNSVLTDAMNQIKTLRGLIPICAACKKIRDDKGYWNQIETYIEEHSEAEFSHGLCPDCYKEYFPNAPKPKKE